MNRMNLRMEITTNCMGLCARMVIVKSRPTDMVLPCSESESFLALRIATRRDLPKKKYAKSVVSKDTTEKTVVQTWACLFPIPTYKLRYAAVGPATKNHSKRKSLPELRWIHASGLWRHPH